MARFPDGARQRSCSLVHEYHKNDLSKSQLYNNYSTIKGGDWERHRKWKDVEEGLLWNHTPLSSCFGVTLNESTTGLVKFRELWKLCSVNLNWCLSHYVKGFKWEKNDELELSSSRTSITIKKKCLNYRKHKCGVF